MDALKIGEVISKNVFSRLSENILLRKTLRNAKTKGFREILLLSEFKGLGSSYLVLKFGGSTPIIK